MNLTHGPAENELQSQELRLFEPATNLRTVKELPREVIGAAALIVELVEHRHDQHALFDFGLKVNFEEPKVITGAECQSFVGSRALGKQSSFGLAPVEGFW